MLPKMNCGADVELIFRISALKSEDEVPMMKPTLSNPLMHESFCSTWPPENCVPTYFIGAKAKSSGSQEPISKGVSSKFVAFKGISVSPGARPSATEIGIGALPLAKSGSSAIEDQVYAGPPAVALTR